MDRILIIMRKKMDPRESSAPLLGLFSIICKHVYLYIYNRSQVSVYRTIGPLVCSCDTIKPPYQTRIILA